ncbi:MAG: DUF2469 domain-containing protein [Candidatus Ancillula sp.]|jgi:hypothetical protein|nr:DUF2469 domain-containing protein [Candidatus Ancillula sp.]
MLEDAELEIHKEYNRLASSFRYSVETERRYYLANEVNLVVKNQNNDVYFEVTLDDAWVWDLNRAERRIKHAHIITFKDVNIEELS